MAIFRIAEFRHSNPEGTAANIDSLIAVQRFSISASNAQSNNLNSATKYVGIFSDVACVWKKGTNPTATDAADSMPHAANTWHYFRVETADKFGVITI